MIPTKTYKVLGIEHIGIAMRTNDEIKYFLDLLPGLSYIGSELVLDQKVDTHIYQTKDSKIELLNSTEENSIIDRFLKKNRNKIHHIALKVDNISNAIKELKNAGIDFINDEPSIGAENCKIAFVHPKSTGGILFELCQHS